MIYHDGLGDGGVRVLDKHGNIRRRLGVTSTASILSPGPHYITVSASGDRVFVFDFSTDTITCLAMDGNTIYRYMYIDRLERSQMCVLR